jgi:hypothetical protein
MFSALWAIANQEAGAPLGQAAPYLYSLPAGGASAFHPLEHFAVVHFDCRSSVIGVSTKKETGLRFQARNHASLVRTGNPELHGGTLPVKYLGNNCASQPEWRNLSCSSHSGPPVELQAKVGNE